MIFSIIIPYYNRPYEIEMVLTALSQQCFNKDGFEVIVVDDGSPEDINQIVQKTGRQINVEYIRLSHSGNRSFNRNKGIERSKGRYLIFLDSEMVTEPDFLKRFNDTIGDDEKLVVLGGYKSIIPFDREILKPDNLQSDFDILRNLPAITDDRIESLALRKEKNLTYRGNWQIVYSNCLCISKKEFLNVGGFDNSFANDWGAEDIELGYRLFMNGNRIYRHERVLCYHLPHPADRHSCISSLKRNYLRFINKHNHWLIELFIREFEAHAAETIFLQEKILDRHWCISNMSITDDTWLSCNKIALFGIEDERLINHPKVACAFVPESHLTSPKIRNMIGIAVNEKNNEFDCALISGEYKNVHQGLFDLLVTEAKRLAAQIIIVNKTGHMILINKSKHITAANEKVLFTLSFKALNDYTRYCFNNLAYSLEKAGVQVGIQADYDPFKKINFNQGYLKSSDSSFDQTIKKLTFHDLNIIGDHVLCFMDRYCSQYSERSFDTRIMWEEQKLYHQNKSIQKKATKLYNKIFVKREWEKTLFSHNKQVDLLPLGINAERIKSVFAKKRDSKTDPFVFMWSDISTDVCSNLPIILETFTQCFGKDPGIELRVIVPENKVNHYDNDWHSDSLQALLRNTTMYQTLASDFLLSSCIEKYNPYPNIRFITDVDDIESYSGFISQANCFISLNGGLEISPLVLEAIGIGVPVIIFGEREYEGYADYGMSFPVKGNMTSACYLETAVIRSPVFNEEPIHHFLFKTPDKDNLCTVILETVRNRRELLPDEALRKRFIEYHDWNHIAKKFKYYMNE